MNNDLYSAIAVSMSGMRAQSAKMSVISQNLANASTAANSPDDTPYARKTITFKSVLDRRADVEKVDVKSISQDTETPFPIKHLPDHPGADENGFVRMPNVRPLMEMNAMRESQRIFEANLGMIEQSRTMVQQAIGLLRR